MKLRVPSSVQQLLFALATGFLLITSAPAQQAGPHIIKLRTGATQQGTVTKTTPQGVEVQMMVGQSAQLITLPFNMVADVQMPPPPEYAAAYQAFNAKEYDKALTTVKTVTDRFKGLPTEWAKQALILQLNLVFAKNDLSAAQALLKDMETYYPGAGTIIAEVGRARVAVSKKDFDVAKQKVTPITEQALKDKNIPAASAMAYSQAFLVLGQVKESAGDLAGALEEYLRTVTIFHHDPAAVAAAQERADALRKENKKLAVP